ncbi:MAG: hypothetical protein Q4E41_03925 [Bacteroidales bacterium]|nr:hypothetical protein [Bacteroidales bacterium]
MKALIIIGPILFGCVIGWLAVYFIRLYKEHNSTNFTKTCYAFLGGLGVSCLSRFMSAEDMVYSVTSYLTGIGIGAFAHLVYQYFVARSLAPRFVSPRSRYMLLSTCNLTAEQATANIALNYKLEKLYNAYLLLKKGKINEEEFKTFISKCGISKQEYDSLDVYDISNVLDSELSAFIIAKGYDEYFV